MSTVVSERSLTRRRATETALAAIGRPSLLRVASHGYFRVPVLRLRKVDDAATAGLVKAWSHPLNWAAFTVSGDADATLRSGRVSSGASR